MDMPCWQSLCVFCILKVYVYVYISVYNLCIWSGIFGQSCLKRTFFSALSPFFGDQLHISWLLEVHPLQPTRIKLNEPRNFPLYWLFKGIVIMVYYNPLITGYLYTLNNQGNFIAQMDPHFWLIHVRRKIKTDVSNQHVRALIYG